LGITSIIKPITVAAEIIDRDLIWMLIFALSILIIAFLPKKDNLSNYKGLIMLLGYFFFIFQAFS